MVGRGREAPTPTPESGASPRLCRPFPVVPGQRFRANGSRQVAEADHAIENPHEVVSSLMDFGSCLAALRRPQGGSR
jgi:hypothetical protein